jgi:FkbM family methyltransferase
MGLDRIQDRVLQRFTNIKTVLSWMRFASNWPEMVKHRNDVLPPIRLRSGEVLHHGRFDSPLLLIDEVWLKQWYSIDAVPPSNGLMLDIGANIGSVTLYWARRVPSLRIHCYEPNPSAFETLRQNVDGNGLNGRATIHSEGVGRSAGTIRLWVDVPTDLSTAFSDTSPREGGRRIEVPIVGIDEVWRRAGGQQIWLLKVDTEGAEIDILEGASASFLAAVQHAIVEYHDNIRPGSFDRCRQVLEKAGFQCRVLHHPWKEGIIYARRANGG